MVGERPIQENWKSSVIRIRSHLCAFSVVFLFVFAALMPLASARDSGGQTPALALVSITDPTADLVVSVDTRAAYDAVLAYAGANGVEVVFESEPAGIVTLSDRGGPDKLVSDLASLPGVLSVSSERKARMLFTPDDPLITYQWALAKVSAYEAWDIAQGNKSTVVAVLDTGIDWNHPDIGPNMWADDDGYHGYNFIADNRIPMDDNIHSYDANGVWIPDTYTYHGTHVAGVVGAVTDNGPGQSEGGQGHERVGRRHRLDRGQWRTLGGRPRGARDHHEPGRGRPIDRASEGDTVRLEERGGDGGRIGQLGHELR
jgi:subtilisin family serine protease